MVTLGLIVNPIAGVGGRAGLKGSDGADIQRLALERGGVLEAGLKAEVALKELIGLEGDICFLARPGAMGGDVLERLGFSYRAVIGDSASASLKCAEAEVTSAADTVLAAKTLAAAGADLIAFAGGDGTARDIYRAIGLSVPCIGIPAGVKIHSAVYANNPKSAGLALRRFCLNPTGAQLAEREVMDLDEDLVRQNIVEAKLYGYLSVPRMQNYMQQAKASARFSTHDVWGIAEEVADLMTAENDDTAYIFGTGGTTHKVMERLGLKGSLLGVDVAVRDVAPDVGIAERVAAPHSDISSLYRLALVDASEKELYEFVKNKRRVVLVLTAIGGQGHILGRGNQQISPRVVHLVKRPDIWIVAAAEKIYSLEGNTLRVDTSDAALDAELSGYLKVITGWQERIVCRVEA